MVVAINISADMSALDRFVLALSAKAPTVLAKAVIKGAQLATGEIRSQLYDVTDGRGGLARSFKERFIGNADSSFEAESFSTLIYSQIQDEGGTIHAKNKLLAVPVRGAKIAPGKWPRHFPKEGPNALHLIPRGGRPPLLAQVRGGKNSQRVIPMFVLLRRVTIKGHRYIDAASAKVAPQVHKLIEAAYASLLGRDE